MGFNNFWRPLLQKLLFSSFIYRLRHFSCNHFPEISRYREKPFTPRRKSLIIVSDSKYFIHPETMSCSRRSRYSLSPSPDHKYRRSVSRSLSRSRSRSYDSSDAENPGNNLYVTGLSARVTKRDLEKHFSTEGMVEDVHLVLDPWTRESRGFGFVTMSNVKEADRCINNLNHSVLEGRVITIEKARRRRGRTPTPGRYLGLRTACVRRRSPSYSPYSRSRSRSPQFSSERNWSRSRSRSRSPPSWRRRAHSPYYSRRMSYSPYYRHRRSYSAYSRSPIGRLDRSYSPYDREYSPDDRNYRSRCYRRSISRSISPRSRRYSRRSYSRSPPRRQWRRSRSYSRSSSPRGSSSRSVSAHPKSSRRRYSRSISPSPRRTTKRTKQTVSDDSYSSRSRSRSRSTSASSRSFSRSITPQSSSP